MKRKMKTLSWRKDLRLNGTCFTGTHATVRFTKGTFMTNGSRVKRVLHATVRVTEATVVTSGSCVKCVLTWEMSRWRKTP